MDVLSYLNRSILRPHRAAYFEMDDENMTFPRLFMNIVGWLFYYHQRVFTISSVAFVTLIAAMASTPFHLSLIIIMPYVFVYVNSSHPS